MEAPPIKILHVVPTYLPATRYGGPIQSVHGLCKALVGLGHEVHVYTTNANGPGDSDVPLGTPVVLDGVLVSYFPTRWPRRLYYSPAMAAQLTKAITGFDLVHIHAMFLWPGLAASRAAQRKEVPYVVSPRGMLVPELIARKSSMLKTAWLQLFDRRMLRKASAVHVTSSVEQEDIRSLGIKARRLLLIPNGIEVPDFGTEQNARQRHVLYLGRLDRKKGVDVLLQAMALLPGVPLVIGGAGEPEYMAELKSLTTRLQLDERVTFLGHLDDTTKWQEYRRASLFVLPSISENFANVVLEAMAAGCPVVVTPGVGMADTVARQECGRVVQRDPHEIAEVVRELLKQPELLVQMGILAKIAAAEFTWAKIARQYVMAYQEILPSKKVTKSRVEARNA